ncbi:hypothetical protein [Haliovirga abyssi]|uniref:Uncharacterized protein n=1 Tax=Haliovirga abyssi TaxID=2996794 RepID=A0AAU9DD61_9FUSO|nr:hypothetical protein [Haliovirga abyssi]BDU51456.1 hypothetical protein HLVA_20250 [Haliovirga abyssi]
MNIILELINKNFSDYLCIYEIKDSFFFNGLEIEDSEIEKILFKYTKNNNEIFEITNYTDFQFSNITLNELSEDLQDYIQNKRKQYSINNNLDNLSNNNYLDTDFHIKKKQLKLI